MYTKFSALHVAGRWWVSPAENAIGEIIGMLSNGL